MRGIQNTTIFEPVILTGFYTSIYIFTYEHTKKVIIKEYDNWQINETSDNNKDNISIKNGNI